MVQFPDEKVIENDCTISSPVPKVWLGELVLPFSPAHVASHFVPFLLALCQQISKDVSRLKRAGKQRAIFCQRLEKQREGGRSQ